MISRVVRRILQTVFSGTFLGITGLVLAGACLAAVIGFSTTWANVPELNRATPGDGHLSMLATKLMFLYSACALTICSLFVLDAFHVREIAARYLGHRWKLTGVLVCTLLASSVFYFFVTFIGSNAEAGEIIAERTYYRHVSVFSYDVIIPRVRFSREDALTALFLFLAGCVSVGMFFFLSLRDTKRIGHALPREFWGAAGAGFFLLAADELFEINRLIGLNAPYLRSMSIHAEPGKYILAVYALLGIVILLAYARDLSRNRWGFVSLLIGLAFQILALSLSSIAWRREEVVEIAEAAMFLIAVIYYAVEELELYIRYRIARSRDGSAV